MDEAIQFDKIINNDLFNLFVLNTYSILVQPDQILGQ